MWVSPGWAGSSRLAAQNPVDGVYRLAADVGELPVPDSLHALLAARLDALDPDTPAIFAAITSLRVLGTPHHLAHGLLDHAQSSSASTTPRASARVPGNGRHRPRAAR